VLASSAVAWQNSYDALFASIDEIHVNKFCDANYLDVIYLPSNTKCTKQYLTFEINSHGCYNTYLILLPRSIMELEILELHSYLLITIAYAALSYDTQQNKLNKLINLQ